MMGQGSAFILPSIEALANLCLSPDQQARCRLALQQQQQQIPARKLCWASSTPAALPAQRT